MGAEAMLKAVAAALGFAPPDSVTPRRSSSSSSNLPTAVSSSKSSSSSSSSAPSNLCLPLFAPLNASPSCNASHCFCHCESCRRLESLRGRGGAGASGSCLDSVLGAAPSRIEVESAVSALQRLITCTPDVSVHDPTAAITRFMHEISSPVSEFNLLQKMLFHNDPTTLQSPGYRRVYDAFHLLLTEPSVQKMVVSLSSDKAVWDAVMNNKAVRELQASQCTAEGEEPQSTNHEPDLATQILTYILNIAKAKVMELIERFRLLVNETFQLPESEKPTAERKDDLDKKLRSSVLLSVMILLIVVVTRLQQA